MAHWAFAFKYFSSALTLPGLFDKSKTLSAQSLHSLDITFWVVMGLNLLIPIAGYAFLWLGHVKSANGQLNSPDLKVKY